MADNGFERNLACIIGINQYSNGIPALTNAVNDAHRIAEILETQHQYQIWLYLDHQANHQTLQQLWEVQLPQLITPGDRLLLYFAGHGIALNGDDGPEGYLIPQDARLGEVKGYYPMVKLQSALGSLPCRHFLGIFDCCFAGAFRWSSTRDIASIPEVIHQERYDRFIQDPAWQVITSADYDQRALDAFSLESGRGQAGPHSPFAAALVEALEGAADIFPMDVAHQIRGDGVITATELYLYLRDRIELHARGAHRQTPGLWPLKKHDKGEYIFLTPGHVLNLPPSPPLDESLNPYRGLEAFEERHHALFFGRDILTQELTTFVENHGLSVVLGASGSGKSSLVKAGLIPNLRQRDWQILPPIRPGDAPVRNLLDLLQAQSVPDKSALHLDRSFLADYLALQRQRAPQTPICLIIDQYEELVTLCASVEDRQAFQQLLRDALAAQPETFHVVITLRSDYEPHFRGAGWQSQWTRDRFIVPSMTRQELRAAIEQPASERVLYFEPSDLVERLIEEVDQMPGALPLLSFTLSELYLQYLRNVRSGQTQNRAITQADYEQIGGVAQALTQRADAEYEALIGEDPQIDQTIQRLMLRMIAVGSGELARRRVMLTELRYEKEEQARVERVIQQFTAARLFVEGQDVQGHPYVEPAHDALIRGWQRLLLWLKAEEERIVLQRRLTPAALEWHENRQGKFLWNADPRLALLKQLFAADRAWFNQVEAEFIQHSLWLKRRNVLARWSALILAFLGLTSLTLWALWNQRNLLIKQAGVFRNAAEVNLVSLPTAFNSIQDSWEALQTLSNPLLRLSPPSAAFQEQVRGTVLSSLYQNHEQARLEFGSVTVRGQLHSAGDRFAIAAENGALSLWTLSGDKLQDWRADAVRLNRVAFHPQRPELVTAGEAGNLVIWSQQGKVIRRLEGSRHLDLVSVSYSPNGRYLSAAFQNGMLGIWTDSGDLKKLWRAHSGMTKTVHFSPNSQEIVTSGADGQTRRWSIEGQGLKSFLNHAWEVVYSPDGKLLASAGDDGAYSLWTLGGEKVSQWQADAERLWAIALRPDGNEIATAGEDGIVRLWTKNGRVIQEYRGHTGPVRSVGYTPDQKYLLTSGDDGTARIWSTQNVLPAVLATGMPLHCFAVHPQEEKMVGGGQSGTLGVWGLTSQRLQVLDLKEMTLSHGIQDVQFSPQGETLAIALENGTIELWNRTMTAKTTISGHRGAVNSLKFSPNGLYLLSGGEDGQIRLWTAQGRPLQVLQSQQGSVFSVDLSPQSQQILSAGRDGTIRLWSMEGTLIHTFRGHIGSIQRVQFQPVSEQAQADLIASAGQDGTIRLWSIKQRQPTGLFRVMGDRAEALAFSPDGMWLASSDREGGLQIWNIPQKTRFAQWRAHANPVVDLAFSHQSQFVISADDQGNLKRWQLFSLKDLKGQISHFSSGP
ncbi:nSTAND1 domain-containing NTPase [Lyngbya confervoides]|uniref:Caspase family protein n=1 Tax=Lyngbya confervoides BDU141951 TaxID=1574623 RepID=A0ABD4T726_9CYAN|nr:caspase family protein [Lyngbya confervoides]MCM1984055.1 caspase family protein [Lyngbya confervoides BDU141951]